MTEPTARWIPDLEALPADRHDHAHATNLIRDAFGPGDGLPFVSVVDRLPQTMVPLTVHAHRGWNELIVMMSGTVVLWCGQSPSTIRPFRLEVGSMFLIPALSYHVFVNGGRAARWMIMFSPGSGHTPAASRREISQSATIRGVAIPGDRQDDVRQSMVALDGETLADPIVR